MNLESITLNGSSQKRNLRRIISYMQFIKKHNNETKNWQKATEIQNCSTELNFLW